MSRVTRKMPLSDDSGVYREVIGRLEAVIKTIDGAREICRAPTLSLGILHEGEVIYTKSLGLRDADSGLLADSDTSYHCGSLSKMVTSTAMAILVGEGKLSWVDLISTHLPDFNSVDDSNIGSNATIIDALRHSCGLANPNTVMLGPYGKWSLDRETHVAMLNALPSSDNSGQRFQSSWNYSNAVFGLLSHIIEKVSGQTFSDFLTQRILQPWA
jgi:CubicO group peptidase (beta-lactamase class C family)